jgi:predicted transcriptional regulator of viral defense system
MPGRVWEKAIDFAADQNGFITFDDMRRLGEDPALLRHWVLRKKIRRVGHGIYRFRHIPENPLDKFMLATLWPSGRGVLSHDTALELHELCDINPDKIHLAVPPGYRPRRQGGEHYVIHHETLGESDVTWHEGIRIVTPEIAIRQALDTAVPIHLVRQAIDTSRRLGRVPRKALDALSRRLGEIH